MVSKIVRKVLDFKDQDRALWRFIGNHNSYLYYFSYNNLRIVTKIGVKQALYNVLEYITSINDTVDLGYYTATKKSGKDYVVVTRSNKRLPRKLSDIKHFNKWDCNGIHPFVYTWPLVNNFPIGQTSYSYIQAERGYSKIIVDLNTDLRNIASSVLVSLFLQCLFDPNGDIDLKKKPLPNKDLKCRVGPYSMLYDYLEEEWMICKKNP